MKQFIIINILIILFNVSACKQKTETSPVIFNVDVSKTIGENTGFWKAIGHDYLFKIVNEPLVQEFLDRAQKKHSVIYYRTHFTFNNKSTFLEIK